MIVQKFKIGEPYNIVLNGGVEIIARINNISGGDLTINCCKKLVDGICSHYPPFSKLNSTITLKEHAVMMICEVDPDVKSVYEQYIENYDNC